MACALRLRNMARRYWCDPDGSVWVTLGAPAPRAVGCLELRPWQIVERDGVSQGVSAWRSRRPELVPEWSGDVA